MRRTDAPFVSRFGSFVSLLGLFVSLLACSTPRADYMGAACRSVKVAVLTAQDFEASHPGEIENLEARIDEANAILDLFCAGAEISKDRLDELRAMGPLLRELLARQGWDSQRIEVTMLGLSAVLNAVEVYGAT